MRLCNKKFDQSYPLPNKPTWQKWQSIINKLLIFLQLFSYLVNYISAFNGVNLFYESSSNNLLYRIIKIQRLDPLYSLTSISSSIIVFILLHKHWAIPKFLEK